jgi:plasmid stabilization system protein ParE
LRHSAATTLPTELRTNSTAAMQKLAEMPGLGHLREDLADERLRFFNVKGYLIVYRPETQPLQVIHVIHAARDVRTILGFTPRPKPAEGDSAEPP